MVSIAESLNYRIFERKWRPGEASNGHPRACRIAQCRTKTQPQRRVLVCQFRQTVLATEWLPRVNRQTVDSWVIYPKPSPLQRVLGRPHGPPAAVRGGISKWKHFASNSIFFVTDLSAAGSPAELKHITQRRKRKQP